LVHGASMPAFGSSLTAKAYTLSQLGQLIENCRAADVLGAVAAPDFAGGVRGAAGVAAEAAAAELGLGAEVGFGAGTGVFVAGISATVAAGRADFGACAGGASQVSTIDMLGRAIGGCDSRESGATTKMPLQLAH
jgi:hypothetical protein